jgi:hypothetical protein
LSGWAQVLSPKLLSESLLGSVQSDRRRVRGDAEDLGNLACLEVIPRPHRQHLSLAVRQMGECLAQFGVVI